MAGDGDRALLIRDASTGGGWRSPAMTAYTDEDHLQAIIADAPHHVPGVPDGAWAVRELPTSAGPADVCIIDPGGDITVVECKLASNSERRRMVIGQVLDYAAAIWQDGTETFHRQWQHRGGQDLAGLGDDAREQLDRNIGEGRIHLCLAVDRIDADLRRLVEYLNRITRGDVRVTALQLAYARHGDVEILVPSTYGTEIAATKARTTTNRGRWSTDTFLAALAPQPDRALAEDLLTRVERLDERMGTHDDFWFGVPPSGGIYLHPHGFKYAPVHLLVGDPDRLLVRGNWTNYPQIKGHRGFAELAAFLGQDHGQSAKAVAVAELDVDRLWEIALRCAVVINGPEPVDAPA
ncbi:hypothetical protein LRS71_23455 [Rhodococcus pyridinivorans]|uniref:hypothetical protein n=1 Tax=Rhodococcus pyridinivorans TaxID=103816 RepID=UPI001E4DBD37|nr:hypothetical protein [Rhodococcus pyridinivorans]MCD5422474.1 hypothetical protein [Rhodococcus pyridinivorans]